MMRAKGEDLKIAELSHTGRIKARSNKIWSAEESNGT